MRVVPGADIEVVRFIAQGPCDRPISPRLLPAYLAGTPDSRVFSFIGPTTAIYSFKELYQP